MVVLLIAAAGVAFWQRELLFSIYLREQLTNLGYVVNGGILLLFTAGVVKLVALLLSYMKEETAVLRFLRNEQHAADDPLAGIRNDTLIARRYRSMESLHRQRTPINQNAMASALVASESTRTSLPKFINNILILTGVFGTIVSLSIALLGANEVLQNAVDAGGMGLVVHGMSTALSTTITAILCFFLFGYFYLRVTDAQTNLISAIEQVTTNLLLPRFQIRTETVLGEFSGLVNSLHALVGNLERNQDTFIEIERDIMSTLDHHRSSLDGLEGDMHEIVHLLRVGFRLRDDE